MFGQDQTTGQARAVLVDSLGRILTVGGAASGTSVAGVNTQLVGGSDGTNVQPLTVGANALTVASPNGVVIAGLDSAGKIRHAAVAANGIAAGSNSLIVGGKDTANAGQQLLVETNGRSARISEGVVDSIGSGVAAAAPTANTVLSTATLTTGLIYKATLNYSITGAIETAGQNLAIQMNGVTIFTVPTNNGSAGGLGFAPIVLPRVTASGNFVLRVIVVANAVASTVYSTTLVITQIA